MDVKNAHILVVDDDRDYARSLEAALSKIGKVTLVHSEDEFQKHFRPYRYDLILLDLRLREEMEGLDLLEFIIEEDPAAAVIVISGYGDIATAVEALNKGARNFLDKSKSPLDLIRVTVEHTLRENVADRRIRQLEAVQGTEEIIGDDPKIKEICELIQIVARQGNFSVLIRGETGTGKELVARAIHKAGPRKDGPFVDVSLLEKNSETITSELFGHEKGAYTGAEKRRRGLFEEAHKGILFLDEIGDLPTDIQVKLLRVLDQRKFRRMGGKADIRVDVQVVTATNRPLEEMVKDGGFRSDLYYRLNVFPIHIPPLRERRSDIPLLARYFLHKMREHGEIPTLDLTDNAIQLMLSYQWPGNVRELESAVKNGAAICVFEAGKKINGRHLQKFFLLPDTSFADTEADILKRLSEQELQMVDSALIKTGGNKGAAQILLGYQDRFTMLRRVKKICEKYPDLVDNFPAVLKSYL